MNKSQSFFVNKDFNPHILRAILVKNWFWVIVFIFVFLVFAFFSLRYTKPIFESKSLIQIEKSDQGKEILELENLSSSSSIAPQVELLKSELLFSDALDKLNLKVSVFSEGKLLVEELYDSQLIDIEILKIKDSSICNLPIDITSQNGVDFILSYKKNNISFKLKPSAGEVFENEYFKLKISTEFPQNFSAQSEKNRIYFTINKKDDLIKRLISNLNIDPNISDNNAVEISYTSFDSKLSHDIVQSVISAFLEYELKSKKLSTNNIINFIDDQLDSLSNELQSSKNSLISYQKNNDFPNPDEIDKDLNINIVKLNDKLFEINDELSTIKMVSNKLKSEPTKIEVYRILPEMLGKSFESSLSLQIQDLYKFLEYKEKLLFDVNDDNNEVKAINKRINNKIASLKKSISVIEERLIENKRVLNQKIGEIESDLFAVPEKKMEYNRLKTLQELNEKYYLLLTEKKVQYEISNAGLSQSTRILSNPTLNYEPISPNKRLMYITFVLFGFLSGVLLLIYKYLRYNEINNAEELKLLLPEQVSILGSVPITKRSMDFSQIIVHDSPKSMLSEALRNIRANMSFVNKNAQTIAISSSISGEGKTFVALNLAAIIAMSGKKTIVIDLDLRKPKIHLGFNTNNDNGMSNLIVNQISLMECIQRSEIINLDFITAGPIPPNPSELILSKDFQNILEKIKSIYDVIIIDNPPVGLVSDGVQVLASADIPIYVFKAHYSKRVFAERVKELFEVQQIQSLNVILNGVVPGRGGYGYDYGYNYGYGYGYGGGYYYEENDKKKPLLYRILKFLRIRK